MHFYMYLCLYVNKLYFRVVWYTGKLSGKYRKLPHTSLLSTPTYFPLLLTFASVKLHVLQMICLVPSMLLKNIVI